MNSNITTNAVEAYRNFEDLTINEMRRVLKSGVGKVLTRLRKETVQNLRGRLKNTNKKNPKFNDTLVSGVRKTKVWMNNRGKNAGEIAGKVRVDSNRKPMSGSYRLAILEVGSYKVGGRYAKTFKGKPLKKKRYTGVLKPYNFLKDATNSMQSYHDSIMNAEIKRGVDKINGILRK